MGGIAEALRGFYGYLLIFQIVVISGLLLYLIRLIVRRTLEATTGGFGAMPRPVAQVTQAIQPSQVPQQEVIANEIAATNSEEAPVSAPAAVAAEYSEEIESLQSENKKYVDKVKFLESKLLEYEILQEEIGTLSALKLENEQLREQVQGLSGGASEQKPAKEEKPAETDAAQVKAAEERAPPKVEAAPTAAAEDAEGELGGLIDQIDNLTKEIEDKKKPAKKKKAG